MNKIANLFYLRLVMVVAAFGLLGAITWNVPFVPTQTARITAKPQVIVEVMDPSLAVFAPMWQREIGRRFDNAVAILVHGGDFEQGRWIVGAAIGNSRELERKHVTEAAEVVRFYQKCYPGRTIVLLACNTGHLNLGVPGVYYAKSSVWCVPDRELTPNMFMDDISKQQFDFPNDGPSMDSRWQSDPDICGNIFEFVTDG